MVVTALPIIRLKISPTPIGLTPGFLSKGINLPAMKVLNKNNYIPNDVLYQLYQLCMRG